MILHPILLICNNKQKEYEKLVKFSDAASGWAGWALAHPEFGSSVNPITTRGADYAHHITASLPGYENPAASLILGRCVLFCRIVTK